MHILQAWCPSRLSSSHGDRARKPSLQSTTTNLGNLGHNNLGEDRQAWGWSSSSPKDPGGAPASTSNWPQPPSSLQLAALEEGMVEEQELLPTTHLSQLRAEMSSLRETVGNLVLLISSFHKDDPSSLHLGTCDEHVWARACRNQAFEGTRGKTRRPQHSLQHNSLQADNNRKPCSLTRQDCKKVSLGQPFRKKIRSEQ